MRTDLFIPGESVLLVGEGNFSFSVGLVNFQQSLTITATCFEHEVQYISGQENIKYLEKKGVRVLLGVDGTKLVDHHILKNEKFSKIVFNFPHVGGKMKIHLNRLLLKEFCKSASELLDCGGNILISLCKGQGGTCADRPIRRWDDTWQIVEMAAHGDLVLVAVEPFQTHMFPNYTCVGYRSRDMGFHMDGALVHIFSKLAPPYPVMETNKLLTYLDLNTLETNFGNIKCSNIYIAKYNNNILDREGSPSHFLSKALENFLLLQTGIVVKKISNVDVPLHINKSAGEFLCSLNGETSRCTLRDSLLDVLDKVIFLWEPTQADLVVFGGLVFHPLGTDFACPPVSSEVLLLGKNVSTQCLSYLRSMLQLFKREDMYVNVHKFRPNNDNHNDDCVGPHISQLKLYCNECVEVMVKCDFVLSKEMLCEYEPECVIGQELLIRMNTKEEEMCLIYPDKMALLLFGLTNWRDLWAEGTYVEVKEQSPILKPASLYPTLYTFDINFAYEVPYNDQDFYNVLWEMAGDIIRVVELVNTFTSPSRWWAKCYRIKYQSSDKALFRERVIKIHDCVIGKVLCAKLGVTVA